MSSPKLEAILREAVERREKGEEQSAEELLDEALIKAKAEAEKKKGVEKAEQLLIVADLYLAKVNGAYFTKAVFATEAVVALRAALALFTDGKNDVGKAKALCKLASVHLKKEHYKAAAEDIQKALELQTEGETRSKAVELKIRLLAKQSEQQTEVKYVISKAEEGWLLAKEAEVAKSIAMMAVVNSYGIVGDPLVGFQVADSEYKAMERDSNLQGMADLICPVLGAHLLVDDIAGALAFADSAIPVHKQLNDKAGEAACLTMHAQLLLVSDQPADAISRSRTAVALYAEVGDADGEAEAKKVLSQALAAVGQADEAPTRVEAQKRLAQLQRAIKDRKGLDYDRLKNELVQIGGISEDDFDEALGELISMDKEGTVAFLREQEGLPVLVPAAERGPGYGKHLIKEYNYLTFRFSGIQYGPRFRLSDCYGTKGNKHHITAYGIVEGSADFDDWESSVITHPGMLDSSLHVNQASGLMSMTL